MARVVLRGALYISLVASTVLADGQKPLTPQERARYQSACPDYAAYSQYRLHPPLGEGPMELPFQRPSEQCRTFSSPMVEKVIEEVTSRMIDKDLARVFENAFPNTLDTTVRWHVDGSEKLEDEDYPGEWSGAQSFIVTGDINAEWLRDSTNQLAQYQILSKADKTIHNLILGAINTQAEYVITAPYCNAFQPPPPSKLPAQLQGFGDNVHPMFNHARVFECKYELDSLAAFLSLTNQFYNNSGSTEFLTKRWYTAIETILAVLEEQSRGTFDPETGDFQSNEYTFQRNTNTGTETLNLGGEGNPLNSGTGLIRSAFRPSDDATILGFFIPANAMMAVELKRTAEIVKKHGKSKVAAKLKEKGESIEAGIYEYGVVKHKKYGDVFAYEVDGYGSCIIMDDANLPSLLALPLMGFVDAHDEIYKNTRRMLLEKAGNPFYLTGASFQGIGGPHVGLRHAWPMSVLVQIMTSDEDEEIKKSLTMVKKTCALGLIHETVNVNAVNDYTRSWFAWANSVFAQTILDLAKRKPHLIFGDGAEPYVI